MELSRKNLIGLNHINFLTDDFGIWQHTKGNEIDVSMGYSLDDSARAFIAALYLELKENAKVYLDYISRSVENDANFFTPDRKPIDFSISNDALGQVYWGLNLSLKKGWFTEESERLLKKITEPIRKIENIRGKSYSLLGEGAFDSRLNREIALELKDNYKAKTSKEWPWIEEGLTYGNAIIPYSFLVAAGILNDVELKNYGLEMLRFLNNETKIGEIPITIGNNGWYVKNSEKNIYDQQPIDPAYQVMANIEAYMATNEEEFLNEAKKYYSWFWGNNILGKPLVDASDDSVRDGMGRLDVDKNKGSENIVCYLIAQHKIMPYLNK